MNTFKPSRNSSPMNWTEDVGVVMTAIRGFTRRRALARTPVAIVLFEIAGDRDLHVNVTHKHPPRHRRDGRDPGLRPAASFTTAGSTALNPTRSPATSGRWCSRPRIAPPLSPATGNSEELVAEMVRTARPRRFSVVLRD